MNATTQSPLTKSEFLGLDSATWFFSGAETPPHRGVIAAVNDYLTARSFGPGGRERNAEIEASCKRNLADLLNTEAANIALLSNASEAISAISLTLNCQPGDNVVINTLEFPSGVLPWLSLKERGIEVRVVEHSDWEVSVEEILDQVDARTRLVMTSHVSYLSGARLDYQRLYQELLKTEALLLLDVTQSLGVVPVELQHSDIIVSSTYKWLLAMHGAGILALNPKRTGDLISHFTGWRSVQDMFSPSRYEKFDRHTDARQFELGYPAYNTVYALEYSSNLLNSVGIENIETHVLELGDQLIAGLQELGVQVMTPSTPERRAGNIAWVCERGEELASALRTENIYLWGGDGRARASIHGFNDSQDIEILLEILKRHRNLIVEALS